MKKDVLFTILILLVCLSLFACASSKNTNPAPLSEVTTEEASSADTLKDYTTAATPNGDKILAAVEKYCIIDTSYGCKKEPTSEEIAECVDDMIFYYKMMDDTAPKCADALTHAIACMERYSCDKSSKYNYDRLGEDAKKINNGACSDAKNYREQMTCFEEQDLCDELILERCGGEEYPERRHRD